MSKKSKIKKQQPAANKAIKKKQSEKISPQTWWALAIIVTLSFIAYIPALHNGFVNLDDDRYVTDNTNLLKQSIAGMFSIPGGFHMGNYHPFTIVGYKIIHSFFKFDPFYYHLINLLIHLLNTILAFFFIRKLTGKFELAFVAGLLFGIHTMHVESVAWVSELKDLLYAFFFFLTLICYLRYLDDTTKKKFLILAVALFACSLFSKAMAASLSAVLFLIDFYKGRKFSTKIIVEKIPFLLLSIGFGALAVQAQKSMGAVQEIGLFHFYERIIFACYGYVTYLWKLVLPLNLSAYYAYPARENNSLPAIYFMYPVILIAIVGATIYSLKYTRKIFFGIAFFSITVFLVLQLLPVGGAVMADRYSYIPSLGIFYLFAEGLYYIYMKKPYRMLAYGLVFVAAIGYSTATYNRCGIWKDGMTMWSDVISKSRLIALAFNNRGSLYNKQAQELLDSLRRNQTQTFLRPQADSCLGKALKDFRSALILSASDEDALNNTGLAYWRLNRLDSAVFYLDKALTYKPDYAVGWSNLGSVLYSMNKREEAVNAYEKAATIDPDFKDAWYNIGIINYNMGRKDKACEALQKAADLGQETAAHALKDLCGKK